MNYKVLIADDERRPRECLAKFVDWNSMGFEVAAKLADGMEVIEYIEKNPVDVILTDIKMTFLSGIELAKYVYEHKSHIKVVLISGYKEFDYAKQALQYNVVNYLLKPSSTEDIRNIFTSLKLQLDQEAQEKQKETANKEYLEEMCALLKEEFFTNLFLGVFRNKTDIARRMKLLNLGFDIENSRCSVLTIKIINYKCFVESNWEYGRDSFYMAIRNFFQTEGADIIYFPIGNAYDSVKFIAVDRSRNGKEEFAASLENDLDSIKTDIKSFLDLDTVIKIETYFTDIFELSQYPTPAGYYAENLQKDINGTADGKSHISSIKMEENSIDRAKQYIEDNYNKDITLEDIAGHVYLNASYLSRLFKEKTGENYSDYLIKIRMQKAVELLNDSRYKVYEVSNMIGYGSLKHFYRLFKRFNGLTPTDYRKVMRKNET